MTSKWTLGGKPLRPGQLKEVMSKAIVGQVKAHLRERFSSIRHPRTGEFPTVVVLGDRLDGMSIRIEGSQELLDLVRTELSEEEREGIEMVAVDATSPRKVFLSYAGEDAILAEKIGRALMAEGIDTWWAGWSLSAGDSIRQKIEEGLSDCTHFVVLLTPHSIKKPWVNTEIDAGFVGKVEARCRFIPLRSGLEISDLTPLLSTMRAPSLDDFDSAIGQLVSDILGLTRKPPLGKRPAAQTVETGYSPAANAVAEFFVLRSPGALWGDVQSDVAELANELRLTKDDIRDALFELRAYFLDDNFDHVIPKKELYSEFDRHFMEWTPSDDALRLSVDVLNHLDFPTKPALIADRYEWTARRLNAALTYLVERDLIQDSASMDSGPFAVSWVERKHDAMRRFVKSRA